MFVPHPRLPLGLGIAAALLALISALAGLANLDLYRPVTPEALIPGTVSQDLCTVLVAVGLLFLSFRLRRDGGTSWLIWLGGIGYTGYAYAIYAFEAVMNPLFPIYVAVFSLSVWSVIAFFARVRPDALQASAPPRRLTAGLFVLLTLLFAFLWSTILLPAMSSHTRADGHTIFVLDLAFVLPLLSLAAVFLWRGHRMGDLLAVPLLIKAGSIGVSVLLGSLIAPAFGLPLSMAEIAIYSVLGLAPLALIWPWMRALHCG